MNEFFVEFYSHLGITVLVSTYLITRGINLPNVDCIINYDFPISTGQYLYQAARAGITFSDCMY